MGKYYNETIYKKGRHIPVNSRGPTRSVSSAEVLIAKLDNGLYKAYPDVTRPSEFEHFYQSYAQGYWLSFDVRAVSRKEIKKAESELLGQVKSALEKAEGES